MKFAKSFAVAGLVVTLLSGCSIGTPSPSDAVRGLLQGMQKGEFDMVCQDYFDMASLASKLPKGQTCQSSIASADVPQGEITIDEKLILVSGDTAVVQSGAAKINGADVGWNALTLTLIDGQWRISDSR